MAETRVAPLVAAVVGAVAVAVAISATRLTIGLVALTVVVAESAVFVSAFRTGRVRRQWVGVVVPVATFFAYVGLTYRVASAPTDGANTGGVLLLVAGFVVVPVLVVITLIYALRLRPDRSTSSR